jgi:DNA polymerase-3 subunit epsilon
MSWHLSRLCAFDVETTGVDIETARIVTAAVLHLGGGQPVERPEGAPLLLDPGVPIPEEASRIHGVTTERARAEGRPAADGVRWLAAELHNAAAAGLPLVAMNAPFDLSVLDRECRRHGVDPLTDRARRPGGPTVRVLDPRVIDKHTDPYRKGRRTLAALCEHYRVKLDAAHDADADAIAAARVVYRLGQYAAMSADQLADLGYDRRAVTRWHALGRMSLDDLHAAQIEWAAEQGRGLAAYYQRQGQHDRAAEVRGDWPVRPLPEQAAA